MAIKFPTKSAAEMTAELFQDRAAPAKNQKSKRPALTPAGGKVSKPPIDELKKKIEAIPAAPAKRKNPVHKIEEGLNEALAVARGEAEPHKIHTRSGRGRPSTGAPETETITLRLDKEIVTKIKAHKDWQKIMKTIIYREFD